MLVLSVSAISRDIIRYRQQIQGRITFGTMLSLIIDWGLMSSFAPINPNYGISLEKAREKVRPEVHYKNMFNFFKRDGQQ